MFKALLLAPVLMAALGTVHAGCFYKDKDGTLRDCDTNKAVSQDAMHVNTIHNAPAFSAPATGLRPGEQARLKRIELQERLDQLEREHQDTERGLELAEEKLKKARECADLEDGVSRNRSLSNQMIMKENQQYFAAKSEAYDNTARERCRRGHVIDRRE